MVGGAARKSAWLSWEVAERIGADGEVKVLEFDPAQVRHFPCKDVNPYAHILFPPLSSANFYFFFYFIFFTNALEPRHIPNSWTIILIN